MEKKEITERQKLRLAITDYWNLLGIPNFYEIIKEKDWKVKSANELSDEKVKKEYQMYKNWIFYINEWSPIQDKRMFFVKKFWLKEQ